MKSNHLKKLYRFLGSQYAIMLNIVKFESGIIISNILIYRLIYFNKCCDVKTEFIIN